MSYLGRKGAVAPLTSADIPVGIVEGTDIAFLENASGTQNLGGTYSTERMYLNDSYTLTGDVTITGHLALGTVADSDVVITDDGSTRTITGSGTLETGELMPKRRETLTGMTGELGTGVTLGSAVTGSPNLNLGNAVFPSGHVIQAKESINTYATAVVGTSYTDVLSSSGTTWEPEITTSSSSSKVLAIFHLPLTAIRNGSNDGRGHYEIHQKIGSANYVSMLQQYDAVGTYDYGGSGIWSASPVTLNRLFSPGSAAVIKYKIRIAAQSSVTVRFGPDSTSEDQRHGFVTLMEISG